ncbi:TetR/AcrR family transcriptional regulator [Modestobacter sp. Leaf380]|uniref:TetR/AcrR family transcriptional regulator n=1 Tax=Modestobacter sp. Leaf380 TaxID=1736356 RepID=UPI0006F1FCCE|nr:TetR/AcrR family transcriptional regulator [Modestobacter sp. Leaf380]KQS73699.1 TetR family transcriptional regulator [Modestobacter sp. Leaf380]
MTATEQDPDTRRTRTRGEVVEVAARLLAAGGADAVTTRAVAAEAGVQAPTIYRLFGDKDGLLDAVAEHVFTTYVAGKQLAPQTDDPVADLRAGWDVHVGFGLANPALSALLADPRRGARSPAVRAGADVLRARVRRVAAAGRLRVSEERAVDLVHSIGTGCVLTLVRTPPEERDLGLVDAAWDAVLAAVTTDAAGTAPEGTTVAAVALRAGLDDVAVLSASERALLAEWLDRITAG